MDGWMDGWMDNDKTISLCICGAGDKNYTLLDYGHVAYQIEYHVGQKKYVINFALNC